MFFYPWEHGPRMSEKLRECAAAFFRATGKDVTTADGFVMGISLELKWMPPSDAKRLLALMVKAGVLEQRDGYVRPASDLSGMDVPMAYRPDPTILEEPVPAPAPAKKEAPADMFHVLMDAAVSAGMERKDFVQGSNRISRDLNIDIAAAALIVLRDNGIDASSYVDDVYNSILIAPS